MYLAESGRSVPMEMRGTFPWHLSHLSHREGTVPSTGRWDLLHVRITAYPAGHGPYRLHRDRKNYYVKPLKCKCLLYSVPAFKKDLIARGREFMVRFSINYPLFWTPRDRNLSFLIIVLPKTRFWSESKFSVSHLLLTNGKKGIVIITNCIVSWLFSP